MVLTTSNRGQLPYYISAIHIAIRISLANRAPITDCDEVYNYWEPLHFLNYGSGLQTWEYAPQYALRTYAYLLPMSCLSSLYQWILSLCPAESLIFLSSMISPSISFSPSGSASLYNNNNNNNLQQHNKVLVFHLLRATFALITSIAELRLIQTILSSSIYSKHVAMYLWVILLTSTGMFHTAPAYLPSSTVMICLFHSLSEQIQSLSSSSSSSLSLSSSDSSTSPPDSSTNTHANANTNSKLSALAKLDNAIIYGLVAVLMTGWPFCAVLFIPLGLFATIQNYEYAHGVLDVLHLFKRVIFYALLIQTFVTTIDHWYYGKILSPTVNIFLYNTGLFSFGGGDDNDDDVNINRDELYGVEDITYYIKNLILNWNVVAVLGVISLPFLIITKLLYNSHHRHELQMTILMLFPMALWVLLVFSRPHKEERFLFPIYPLLALGAALFLDKVVDILTVTFSCQSNKDYRRKAPNSIKTICGLGLLVPFALISISRSVVLSDGYTAPLQLYTHLHQYLLHEEYSLVEESNSNMNQGRSFPLVCTGGEWYRFPSSYHLPHNFQLAFLKSSFGGQLPQQFTIHGSKEDSLLIQSGQFNDLNKEETDRYVSIEECSFVIELLSSEGSSEYLKLMDQEKRKWVEVARYNFLDAENTPAIHRILFLPYARKAHYRSYTLFKAI